MGIQSVVDEIRLKYFSRLNYRLDDGEEEEEPQVPVRGHGNTRLPYGLCKSEGINTEGMTPREAWEAYYGKTGVSPEQAYKDHFGDKKPAGGSTVDKKQEFRNRLRAAKNNDEVKSCMNEKYPGVAIGEEVVANVQHEDFKSTMEALDSLIDEFPELRNTVITTTSPSGIMSCSLSGAIKFGGRAFKEGLANMCKESSGAGYWPPNSSPGSVLAHEFGHAVDAYIIRNSGDYVEGFFGDGEKKSMHEAWRKGDVCSKIISQACRDIKKTAYGKGKKNDELVAAISRQAISRGRPEAFAEAFADCYANGENANPLSLRIKELALQRIREISGR